MLAFPRRRSVRLLSEHVQAAAAASVRPAAHDRVVVHGPTLFHVGVVGSGIAVGYGVTRRWEALDGLIAASLAEATGRGVAISNWSRHEATLDDQLREAAMSNGFAQARAVLWCPSYLQMLGGSGARRWRRQLEDLLEQSARERPVVVAQMPEPFGDDPVAAISAPITRRINETLHAVAADYPRVAVVPVPPVHVRELGVPLFDAAYYRAAAPAVAAALLAMIGAGQGVPDRRVLRA